MLRQHRPNVLLEELEVGGLRFRSRRLSSAAHDDGQHRGEHDPAASPGCVSPARTSPCHVVLRNFIGSNQIALKSPDRRAGDRGCDGDDRRFAGADDARSDGRPARFEFGHIFHPRNPVVGELAVVTSGRP